MSNKILDHQSRVSRGRQVLMSPARAREAQSTARATGNPTGTQNIKRSTMTNCEHYVGNSHCEMAGINSPIASGQCPQRISMQPRLSTLPHSTQPSGIRGWRDVDVASSASSSNQGRNQTEPTSPTVTCTIDSSTVTEPPLGLADYELVRKLLSLPRDYQVGKQPVCTSTQDTTTLCQEDQSMVEVDVTTDEELVEILLSKSTSHKALMKIASWIDGVTGSELAKEYQGQSPLQFSKKWAKRATNAMLLISLVNLWNSLRMWMGDLHIRFNIPILSTLKSMIPRKFYAPVEQIGLPFIKVINFLLVGKNKWGVRMHQFHKKWGGWKSLWMLNPLKNLKSVKLAAEYHPSRIWWQPLVVLGLRMWINTWKEDLIVQLTRRTVPLYQDLLAHLRQWSAYTSRTPDTVNVAVNCQCLVSQKQRSNGQSNRGGEVQCCGGCGNKCHDTHNGRSVISGCHVEKRQETEENVQREQQGMGQSSRLLTGGSYAEKVGNRLGTPSGIVQGRSNDTSSHPDTRATNTMQRTNNVGSKVARTILATANTGPVLVQRNTRGRKSSPRSAPRNEPITRVPNAAAVEVDGREGGTIRHPDIVITLSRWQAEALREGANIIIRCPADFGGQISESVRQNGEVGAPEAREVQRSQDNSSANTSLQRDVGNVYSGNRGSSQRNDRPRVASSRGESGSYRQGPQLAAESAAVVGDMGAVRSTSLSFHGPEQVGHACQCSDAVVPRGVLPINLPQSAIGGTAGAVNQQQLQNHKGRKVYKEARSHQWRYDDGTGKLCCRNCHNMGVAEGVKRLCSNWRVATATYDTPNTRRILRRQQLLPGDRATLQTLFDQQVHIRACNCDTRQQIGGHPTVHNLRRRGRSRDDNRQAPGAHTKQTVTSVVGGSRSQIDHGTTSSEARSNRVLSNESVANDTRHGPRPKESHTEQPLLDRSVSGTVEGVSEDRVESPSNNASGSTGPRPVVLPSAERTAGSVAQGHGVAPCVNETELLAQNDHKTADGRSQVCGAESTVQGVDAACVGSRSRDPTELGEAEG
nr:MAG: hypothetical protein [Carmotetraviridae sp.]